MKIAVTVWNHRISPVLDAARTLLIVEVEKGELIRFTQVACEFEQPHNLLQLLRSEGVDTLICGAVSEESAKVLAEGEVSLMGFIAGEVQEVLRAFVAGGQLSEHFRMPGCGKVVCCRGKIRCGHQFGKIHGARRRQEE